MPDNAKKYTLKVFSGPHLGAEILLDDGEYTIGRDENSDIIFFDESVSAHHLRLSILDGALRLSHHEGAVYLDGDKIDEDVDLSPYQMVTIGTTHFAVCLTGEDWPALHPAEIALDKDPVISALSDLEIDDEASGSSVPFPARKRRTWPILVLLGLGLLLIVVFPFFFSNAPDEQRKTVPVPADQTDAIQAILNDLGLKGLKTVTLQDGTTAVQGYVEKQQHKRDLVNALRKKGITSPVQVYAAEDIVAAADGTIAAMGLDLTVRWVEDGKIALEGRVKDKAALDKTLALLKQDIQGLQEIDNQAAFDKPVPVVARKIGTPSKNKDASGKPKTNAPSKPELSVRAISIGPFPYITMADGNKYFMGARLKDGFVIKEIKNDRVILVKDGHEFNFDLRGE